MNLFIDTSTQAMILILSKNNQIIDYHFELVFRDHASRLLPNIDALIKKNNLISQDLQAIYVAEGPGSYTGIRIGVTVAKVLSYSLQIPLFSISSLEVIAASYLNDADYLIPLIDARRGNVFSAVYQVKHKKLNTLLSENLYSLVDLLKEVNKLENKKVLYLGIDCDNFINLIEQKNIRSNLKEAFNPELIMNLTFQPVKDVHQFVPNYNRLTEAERNLL